MELGVEARSFIPMVPHLPVGAKGHNAFATGWFRSRQNFDGDCPLRRNGAFGELDESHALVAVASNDFHRLGVSIDATTQDRRGQWVPSW